MHVLTLGAGRMGRAVAYDMVNRPATEQVTLVDADGDRIEQVNSWLGSERVRTTTVDVRGDELFEILETSAPDVVVNALPYTLSVPTLQACIEAGVDAVDMTFADEQYDLDRAATEAGVVFIPGCGVAPGLSNLLAGYGAATLDEVTDVSIEVGGLPQNPEPPLQYRVVFNVESLWREYTIPARTVEGGELVEVEPLSGVETVEFPSVGELECFYTRGISTLPKTFDDTDRIEEKTVRYPGHARKIKTLQECGLLDTEPVDANGTSISPREFLTALLDPELALGDAHDLTVMRVEVRGIVDGDVVRKRYEFVDHYDDENEITSMARTTGYTAAAVARAVAGGRVPGSGLVPPEVVGMDRTLAADILAALADRGIVIEEK